MDVYTGVGPEEASDVCQSSTEARRATAEMGGRQRLCSCSTAFRVARRQTSSICRTSFTVLYPYSTDTNKSGPCRILCNSAGTVINSAKRPHATVCAILVRPRKTMPMICAPYVVCSYRWLHSMDK